MLAALIATWLLAAPPVSTPAIIDLPARLLVSRGSVDIVRAAPPPVASGADVSLERETLLAPGDQIVLREKALVSLQEPAGILQFIGPGEARIVAPAHYLWQGERAVISALAAPVQLGLEGGTLQVGAGLVRVRQTGRGTVVEALDEGQAAVAGPSGVTTLKPGAGILLRQAGPAAETALLPEAPALLLPGPHNRLRTFRFKWRAVPGAASYRLELSRDPMFQEIIYARESTGPVISDRARSLPVGLLFWRVATHSAEGFEGIPSKSRAFRVAP